MKTRKSELLGKQVMLEGMMVFGRGENGQHTLDFQCCEDVVAEPFGGTFDVQVMRDGNVYITEERQKVRVRNKALFREDNASLSLGQNHKYYFVFQLDEELLEELPVRLVSQAKAIARKVIREYELDVPFEIFD